jgi:predicted TIM-barrel fold metal-dependent hydrolase
MKLNISDQAKDRITQQLRYLEKMQVSLVIDADTHISDFAAFPDALKESLNSNPDYYQGRPVSAEDLLAEMKMSGVDMALVWQNPAATFYPGTKDENFHALLETNRYIFETSRKWPEKFIPAGWIDPKAIGMELAKKLVCICVEEFGFGIVKLNPAQNAYPIDSNAVKEVLDLIVSKKAVPAFHFGADTEFTPAEGLANLAKRNPDHPIIGVHMGGGGASYHEAEDLYHQARKTGLDNPNIRFVLSAKRDTHIENDIISYTLAGEPFCRNLFCASDAPYGRMSWNFGGFRGMFASLAGNSRHTDPRVRKNPKAFNEKIFQGYLGGNMAGFMVEVYKGLLS